MFVHVAAHASGRVHRAYEDGGSAHVAPTESSPMPTTWKVVRHSLLELLLALVLFFGVTGIVRWVAGPSPVSEAIPEVRLQLPRRPGPHCGPRLA
jgi:hypothetical protein